MVFICGREDPLWHKQVVPECPGCGKVVRTGFDRLLGLDTVAVVCAPCDLVYVLPAHVVPHVRSKDTWTALKGSAGKFVLRTVNIARVVPGDAKDWWSSEGSVSTTPLSEPHLPSYCLTRPQPPRKTPETGLHFDVRQALPGPLRLSHFRHGTVRVLVHDSDSDTDPDSWFEVSFKRQFCRDHHLEMTCTRPSVPGHGVVLRVKAGTCGDRAPGTAVTVSFGDHIHWMVCTNCSTVLERDEGALEPCGSSPYLRLLLLTCFGCGARMLFDWAEFHEDEAPVAVGQAIDARHVFLAAKHVAVVFPGPDLKDGVRCDDVIIALPGLAAKGVVVQFADGTFGRVVAVENG